MCNVCGKKVHKEANCQSDAMDRLKKKKIAVKDIGSFSLPSVFVALTTNNENVKLQLNTASDITSISIKTWRTLGYPAVKEANHIVRNPSGDAFLGKCISLVKNVHCILAVSIRNIPVTVEELKHASTEDSVIKKSYEICENEMAVLIVKRGLVGSISSIVNPCLMFNERRKSSQQFHPCHPGINRVKTLAGG
ncbi:hypothetical protein ACTXT7_014395 [Hymenolepis weldensis]